MRYRACEVLTPRVRFVRTVSIALGIAECVKLPATRLFAPIVAAVLGSKLKHWVSLACTSLSVLNTCYSSWTRACYSSWTRATLAGHGLIMDLQANVVISTVINLGKCPFPSAFSGIL